jgi:cbb3-type cytochrome oxidase subunit 3
MAQPTNQTNRGRNKLASRANTLSVIAFFVPLLAVVVFHYGRKLRHRGNQFGEKIIGRAIGAAFSPTPIALFLLL